jgi:hypothetical protein
MNEWLKNFWNKHGDRLIFAGFALSLQGIMRLFDLEKEANTILIGIAMLFFNKARGNGTPTK